MKLSSALRVYVLGELVKKRDIVGAKCCASDTTPTMS